MNTAALVFAYAAAALVAVVVTAAFSPAMRLVLSKLLPQDILDPWSKFTKFALFVASFAGGIPDPNPGRFIDRNSPLAAPPIENAGLELVMRAVGGALMAASWILLVFFCVTLGAYMASRVWHTLRQRRVEDAKEIQRRQDERLEAKAQQDASEGRSPEPHKRQEPAEPRPVRKEPSAAEKTRER